ncbi:hypothetical protein LCGC14_2286740, partial [marine sediment metagenome]
YCHSDGSSTTPNNSTTPSWGSGFIGCSGCHGSYSSSYGEPDYANTSAGAVNANSHNKHVVGETIACKSCHNDTTNDGSTTFANGIHIDGFKNVAIWSVYDSDSNKYNNYTPGVPNKTCDNIYCHAGTQQTWGGASLDCGSCHDANWTLPGRHSTHYNSVTNSTSRTGGNDSVTNNYIFNCGVCHDGTQIEHAGGEYEAGKRTAEVIFNTNIAGSVPPASNTTGGSYYTDGLFNFSNATCTTYCHSQGEGPAATYTDPNNTSFNWNSPQGTLDCIGCHDSDDQQAAMANRMSTGRHTAHINNTTFIGDNFACNTCHAGTVSASSNLSIIGKDFHVNAVKNVVFNGVNPSGNFTQGADTCDTLYCHSDGSSTTPNNSTTPTWGSGGLDCQGCHGSYSSSYGEPDYVNTSAGATNANSHDTHVVVGGFVCKVCHNDTTDTATNPPTSTFANRVHIDGVKNVAIWSAYDTSAGDKYDNYVSGTKTCSDIACHGGGSPQWGDSLTCDACHLVSGPDVDDYTWTNFASGFTQAQINTTDWGQVSGTVYGHGGTTGNLPLVCTDCHDSSAAHGGPTNYFRLRDSSDPGGD